MDESSLFNSDFKIFDSFTIYFELDSLSNRLKNKEGNESFRDSLERLTVCQYEDSLDSLHCSVDSLDGTKNTESFIDSLDEELLSDSLEDSDTQFYSLDAVGNASKTLHKDLVETATAIEAPLLENYPEHVHSHLGCQHTLLQDYLSQSPVNKWEGSNVLDFLIIFGQN